MMELRHLRYFVAVAEELHFGRAAARLGISQPPLSQQLRALEQELGAPLLERTSRRVRLTDAGALFLDQAREVIAQADRATNLVRRFTAGDAGELGIGFVSSAPFVAKVAAALYRFRRACPSISLRLAELSRDDQITAIDEGRIDLGFLRSPNRPVIPGTLVAVPYLEEDLLVAMRRDHRLASGSAPIRIETLAEEDFVLNDPKIGAGFNEALEALCRRVGFQIRVVQEVAGLATLLGLVAAGFGITVLPRSLGALHLDDLVYRPLEEPSFISRLWLVHRADCSPSCRRFLALACDGQASRDAS
jgi:DNA-binding transcriptional LysR family regulator